MKYYSKDHFLYSLALPLLVCLAAFSSKERFPDSQLTIFFSWSLLLVFGIIFVRNFNNKLLAGIIVLTTVFLRCTLLVMPNISIIVYLYNFLFALVVIFSGTCVFFKIPVLLLKQMFWFSVISILMSLLQINGVKWAQEFGSAISWKQTSNAEVLFINSSSLSWITATQYRPDGLTHANNLTSQLLLIFYAYTFYFYLFKLNLNKITSRSMFSISFACALNGGKIIVFSVFFILAFTLIFHFKSNKQRLIRALSLTFAGYLLDFILFPGLFNLNFNSYLFFTNASGRVMNLSGYTNISGLKYFANFLSGFIDYRQYSSSFETQQMKAAANEDFYSGVAMLIPYLPLVIPSFIIVYQLWRKNLWRIDLIYFKKLRTFMSIMFITMASSIFGGPFFSTIWFTFFISFVLLPITLPLMTNHFQQSLSS